MSFPYLEHSNSDLIRSLELKRSGSTFLKHSGNKSPTDKNGEEDLLTAFASMSIQQPHAATSTSSLVRPRYVVPRRRQSNSVDVLERAVSQVVLPALHFPSDMTSTVKDSHPPLKRSEQADNKVSDKGSISEAQAKRLRK